MKLAALCLVCSCGAGWACEPGLGAVPMLAKENAPAVYLTVPAPPVSEPFDIELQFCGDITTVSVSAIMPAHQHGMNYFPKIEAREDGVVGVSGMVFHMPGIWQIQVSSGTASYTHDITVQ
ncbi:MAG: hypothetical protein ABJL99_00585 [Aliishimia sp.]